MNQDESIALWRQGKEAWNAWADDILRQKAELEKAGTWQVEDDGIAIMGSNSETRKWMETAQIDLSGLHFMSPALAKIGQEEDGSPPPEADVKTLVVEGDTIGFNGFVFPWLANFRGAQFYGEAEFGVDFQGAQFHGQAHFRFAEFHGQAYFLGAQFHQDATFRFVQFRKRTEFKEAQFHEKADFQGVRVRWQANFREAQFHRQADFSCAEFHWQAWFRGAEFHGQARFRDVQFHGEAVFKDARFHGEAGFIGAYFESGASFGDALFGGKANPQLANFTGIKADRGFDLTGAQFSKVPAFSQADYKQAPDLDNVSLPHRPFWRGGDKNLVPQYRALKRLAVQGYDYEREQLAFKGELRARRWVIDKWYGPSVWLGMVYDAFADCGRSIWRPFIAWVALVFGFGAFYFSCAEDGFAARCGGPETPALQALYLSIKNGLVVFGGTRDARINQAYHCLYSSQSGISDQANIPLSVTFVETLLQMPISAVLLFLFLLGVRNQFKIK